MHAQEFEGLGRVQWCVVGIIIIIILLVIIPMLAAITIYLIDAIISHKDIEKFGNEAKQQWIIVEYNDTVTQIYYIKNRT